MARLGFAIDNRVCIGCHACTVACKSEHSVPIGVNRTWVKYIEKGTFPDTRRSFSVQRCNHCDNAPCVEICPVTSLYQRPDGIVDFDSSRCIGCKACMQACPYDAIYLDPETLTAAKCNYCTHRTERGLEPACVVVCPVEAIVSGDLDDPTSRISMLDKTQRVQYPKVEKGTEPKLFYVGGDTAATNPTEAPPAENYLWSGTSTGISGRDLDAARQESEDASTRARRVYDAKPTGTVWGPMVSAYVTTKAISAGTVMVAFLSYWLGTAASVLPIPMAIASLLFLAVTGVLLVADLKQPSRFLYVLLRPQWRSWLVKGAYLITLFSLAAPVCLIMSASDAGRSVQLWAGAVSAILAALAAIYTAFLFAQAKGRDYWQNPLLVFEMLADALVAGVIVAALLGSMGWTGGLTEEATRSALGWGIIVLAALRGAELLTVHPSKNAAMTAAMIVRGSFAMLHWWGVVAAGMVLPGVILLFSDSVAPAALLVMLGLAVKAHILVQAPQRIPLS